jgi:hypothetical protein
MLEIYEFVFPHSAGATYPAGSPAPDLCNQVRASNHSSNSGCAAASEKQVFDKGGACQSKYAIAQQSACHHEPSVRAVRHASHHVILPSYKFC